MTRQKLASPLDFHSSFLAGAALVAGGICLFILPVAAEDGPEPEATEIVIDAPGSAPVAGDDDNVTVVITGEGSILAAGEPAVRGEGAHWSVDNSGLLQQSGEARATVELAEGTFVNRAAAEGEAVDPDESEPPSDPAEPGRILWNSAGDLNLTEDATLSAVLLHSWTQDAANDGTIRLHGADELLLAGTGSRHDFSGVYLGGRRADSEDPQDGEAEGDLLTFTNRGEIFAGWSGAIDSSGTGNELRFTGVHLEEHEKLTNDGTIEALFDGELIDAAGDRVEVSGVRTDGDGEILNTVDGVIRATIDATGNAEGTNLSATGIRSEGHLSLTNRGTVEAIVTDSFIGTPDENTATGVSAGEGAVIQNSGTIHAENASRGSAVGISLQLESSEPQEPENEDDPPPAPRSQVTNTGTISAWSDGGTAIGIHSDGNLTLTNQANGVIEVTGFTLPEPEPTATEGNGEDEEEPLPPTTPFHRGVAVLVENGDGDVTNRGTIRVTGEADILEGVVLLDGGVLRNFGTIEVINQQDGGTARAVYLGDEDARLVISPEATIIGEVDGGGGHNVLELAAGGTRGVYDGSYLGFDELNIRARGTVWTLTGDQAYVGGTEIFEGFLRTEEGQVLESDVHIHRDGFLISAGTVRGNLTVAGLVSAGDVSEDWDLFTPGDSARLLVEGDVSFLDGGVLFVIPGETWLEVDGSVTIGGQDPESGDEFTTRLHLLSSSAEWGEEYLVLISGDGITGEFDNLTTEGGRPFLKPILLPGDYEVHVRMTADEEALLNAARTGNQRAVAQALGKLQPSAALVEGYREFFREANAQNFGQIADSMSGEIIASGAVAAPSLSQGFRQSVINTIQHRSDPASRRYSAPPGSQPATDRTADRAFWTRAVGIWGDLDRPDEGGSADYRVAGLLVGTDFVSTPTRRTGIAFGYGDSRVSHGGDRVDGNLFQLSGYATRQGELLVYDGIVGYAFHNLESQRRVLPANERVRGSYSGHELFSAIQATMPIDLEGILFLPLAGIDYSYFRQNSFSESGTWGLDVGSADLHTFRVFFGARFLMEHITARNGVVSPEIRVGSSYAFLDRDTTLSARFREDEAGTRFATRGAANDRSEMSVGAGLMVQPGRWDGVSIFADYDFNVQRHHVVSAGVRIGF